MLGYQEKQKRDHSEKFNLEFVAVLCIIILKYSKAITLSFS